MNRFITQLIDRTIIRLVCATQPKAGSYPARRDEASELLGRPDFFPEAPPAPNLKWISTIDFEFQSAIPGLWPETNTVHGKFFLVDKIQANKPTVILIHGWNDELGYRFRHAYLSRQLNKTGVNVAMLELPYHLQRRPRGRGAVNDFLSENLLSNMVAVRQAISDIRALISWLHSQGCSRIGLCGVSLGGWLTGLTSCLDERVRFAVLTIPVARMDRVVNELAFCAPIRRSLNGKMPDYEKLNLRFHRPKVPTDKILIIEAEDDLFAFKDAIEEFRDAWGRPEIWRFQHAHISILFSTRIMKQTVEWIAAKA